ncbi:MAG: HIT domain-containing protein [Deltaproteobacteria bacterium]|nr:HIT domain-containing protein [Deltaproteobacteria bacterium]
MFHLDPRLQNDCILLGDFPLSQLLLLNEATYPWFVLVPRREKIEEIYQLDHADQQQFWQESAMLGRWMSKTFQFDKLNVAALGNVVRQLHLHHVGRCMTDPTWPGPVWGQHPPQPYTADEIEKIKQQVSTDLAAYLGVDK